MNAIENIQYCIEKSILDDEEFYAAVMTYLNDKQDNRLARTILWELSHPREEGTFFIDLDFSKFKLALDNMKIVGDGYEK